MEIIYRRCAGLDVHKKSIMANVRQIDERGKLDVQTRKFGTMTRDLLALSDWLASHGVTHVAMESTGVFWKPVFNLLEGRFEVLLVNPQHIKQVPGRKTDVKDCEWIGQLLQHGLLRGSFVPPRPQRDLRDLTRHRAQLVAEQTRVANRIHKTLEDANVKLGSVASDILGKSGRDMIQAIIRGEDDPEKMAELARARLRAKIPQLQIALEGRVTEHHRFMLNMLMEHLDMLEELIGQLNQRIEEKMLPFAKAIQRICTIPGVDRLTAQNVLAEVGTEMTPFPSDAHLASWSGMCPGNNESAGKRRRGKTTKGNRWLRRALSQAAWAASRTKNTYLSSQYRRLAGRRGKKRAVVAVGHTILSVVYHLLKHETTYADLGADYFDRIEPERLTRYLVKRLESLGHRVTLNPQSDAA
jgi:transposase